MGSGLKKGERGPERHRCSDLAGNGEGKKEERKREGRKLTLSLSWASGMSGLGGTKGRKSLQQATSVFLDGALPHPSSLSLSPFFTYTQKINLGGTK